MLFVNIISFLQWIMKEYKDILSLPFLCTCRSHVQLFVTPWTVARQTLLSMGFSREEYWSGLPCPHPGDLPDPEIELRSPALQADTLSSELVGELVYTFTSHLSST